MHVCFKTPIAVYSHHRMFICLVVKFFLKRLKTNYVVVHISTFSYSLCSFKFAGCWHLIDGSNGSTNIFSSACDTLYNCIWSIYLRTLIEPIDMMYNLNVLNSTVAVNHFWNKEFLIFYLALPNLVLVTQAIYTTFAAT